MKITEKSLSRKEIRALIMVVFHILYKGYTLQPSDRQNFIKLVIKVDRENSIDTDRQSGDNTLGVQGIQE